MSAQLLATGAASLIEKETVVSNKGALSRSNLILFVLVLVLVNQNFIGDEGRFDKMINTVPVRKG